MRIYGAACVLTALPVSTETVVAESVVVIKKLLQTQPTQHGDIIKHMAKLFDNITVWVILFHYGPELETL